MSNESDPRTYVQSCASCPIGRLAGVGDGGFCPLISRRFAAGDIIFESGDEGTHLWFVKKGKVELRGEHSVSRLPGALVGLSSLAGAPYVRTAVATEDTVLCGATRDGFVNLLELAHGGD